VSGKNKSCYLGSRGKIGRAKRTEGKEKQRRKARTRESERGE